MIKSYTLGLLCFFFIITTSGNSTGLFFKNMAKVYHLVSLEQNLNFSLAEELVEDLKTHNVTTILAHPNCYFKRILPKKNTFHFSNNYLIGHILEIPVPPPQYL